MEKIFFNKLLPNNKFSIKSNIIIWFPINPQIDIYEGNSIDYGHADYS